MQFLEDSGIIVGRCDHCHVLIILGSGADHRRPANVDILDNLFMGDIGLRQSCLKGVEVAHHQVDGSDPLLLEDVLVLGIVYLTIVLIVDTTYVMTASALSRRLLQRPGAQKQTARFAAGTYIALGVAAAALGDRPSGR